MTTTAIDRDDDGDGAEFSQGLAALERHLADVADTEQATAAPVGPVSAAPVVARRGWTRRVRRRVAEHDEAHRLLELEHDTAPFEVTTDRVRDRRKAVNEAAALHLLDRDPRVLAYRDARVRRLIVAVALVSLTLALAWSTAGVQAFAAEGAPAWSPQWVFAWLAEPFCSLALLMVVTGRAYLTTRGHPLESKSVDRTEWVFLGLTLGMNAWPHLPGVADAFTVSGLVLHLLGPVVAVAVVRCLPHMLAAFGTLALTDDDHPDDTPPPPPVADPQPAVIAASTSTPAKTAAPAARTAPARRTAKATIPTPRQRSFEQLQAEFEQALKSSPDGFDPSNAESIRRTLACGKAASVRLKKEHLRRTDGD